MAHDTVVYETQTYNEGDTTDDIAYIAVCICGQSSLKYANKYRAIGWRNAHIRRNEGSK